MSTCAVRNGNGPVAGMTIAPAQRSLTGTAADALSARNARIAAESSSLAHQLDKSGRITTDSAYAKPEQPHCPSYHTAPNCSAISQDKTNRSCTAPNYAFGTGVE